MLTHNLLVTSGLEGSGLAVWDARLPAEQPPVKFIRVGDGGNDDRQVRSLFMFFDGNSSCNFFSSKVTAKKILTEDFYLFFTCGIDVFYSFQVNLIRHLGEDTIACNYGGQLRLVHFPLLSDKKD